MCRSSVCRFLLGSCSNPGTPKSQSGPDEAEASRLDPSSAADDVKTFSELEFDRGDAEVNAQSGIDGGSTSLGAEAMRMSLPFNRDSVRSDAFCTTTASYQTNPLSTASPFNTTSFLAACLFRSREHSLNHALLPIGSFHPQIPSKPPPDPIVSPVRQSLGLDPEILKNMPSLQPGTADEERARRREATRHQEKSQFPNVLRHADASPATAPQSRPSEARPKRSGSVKDTQNRDKVASRPSTRPADAQPDPTSLKSTVTPVSWDNPLKTQPYIYNPSPTDRPANHKSAKPSAAPCGGGCAKKATPRSSADSVRPRPSADGHGGGQADAKSLSKRPAAPVVGSKPASTNPSSQTTAAALLAVQPQSTHPSTAVVRTSTESLPMTGLLPSTPCGPQKGTRSKPVAAAATEIVERGKERYEEWHKKRANMRYPNEQELYQKLVEEGRVSGRIHRPPVIKTVEADMGAKQEKSPVPSIEDLKSTTLSIKGSKTSLLQTGSTESLASRQSSKGPRPSTGGYTGSGQVVQKERSTRADRRDTAKPTPDTSQPEVKPSSTSARRASPSTRDQGSVKQARSRPSKAVSSAHFPTAPPEDGTRDDSSLKRAKKPSDGSARAEKREEVAPERSTESPVKSSRPSGDSGTRAWPTLQYAGADKVRPPAVPVSDVNSVKTASSTKSPPRPSIPESLRTDGSVRESSHKPSPRNGTTSQPEGVRKRIRTLSTTAIVSDAPPSDMFRDDWPTPEDLLADMPFATTSGLPNVSPMKTPASKGKLLQAGSVASAKGRPLRGGATPGDPTEKVEIASSTRQAVPHPSSRVDKMTTTMSDPSLQLASRRSSGVSYATVNEPPSKDPASPPVTLRTPIARQLPPHSPLLHHCFESIVTDDNTYSVVTDNFDPESYPLAFDRTPLPSIPVQVVSAWPELTPRALDLPTFTRGRIEPPWPALKLAAVELKPAARSVATVKEVRFTENSSEESLLEDAAHTTRQSARLTIFPNASTMTVSTSSGSGLSLGATPLPSSRQSPVPPTDIHQKAKAPAEDPPSYDDSVPTRRRTQSDATDKKDRLLLNARLPGPYIDSLFRTREANMAYTSARAQKEVEQNGRPRKPSTFKRILGQLGAPFGFKKKKEEEELGGLALARSMSAQPRAGPSRIHWMVSQTTRR